MAEPIPGRARRVRAGRILRAPLPGCVPGAGRFLYLPVLFEELTSWANLLLAFRNASRGKRGRPAVAAFEHRLEENLLGLQVELRSGSYRPGAYHSFLIHDPKRRLISAAPFRDRVVHHALCNVIEPLFERRLVADTFANRCGKGTHRALDRCQQLARRYPCALQLDVRQYFPSIDHALLREMLARQVSDPGVLSLIDRVLAGGEGVLGEVYEMVYFPGDDLFAALRPRGLPIGNLTSQFWANVYLDPVDQLIKRQVRPGGYVRYVDDLVLFAESKRALWEAKAAVCERLARLRLLAHPGAPARPVSEGIPFLGFVVFAQRRRLKRRKGIHFRRHLATMLRGWRSGEVTAAAVAASLDGWLNHLRHGDTAGLAGALLRGVPDPIRELLSHG